MEDKSLMTRSDKLTPKRKKSNIAPSPLIGLEQQMAPPQKVFDAIPLAVISVDWKGQSNI
jgi:hypothetical protein